MMLWRVLADGTRRPMMPNQGALLYAELTESDEHFELTAADTPDTTVLTVVLGLRDGEPVVQVVGINLDKPPSPPIHP